MLSSLNAVSCHSLGVLSSKYLSSKLICTVYVSDNVTIMVVNLRVHFVSTMDVHDLPKEVTESNFCIQLASWLSGMEYGNDVCLSEIFGIGT